MARPIKKGLLYYNMDTDRYSDKRIKRLKRKFSCLGMAVYDYVLSNIYREEGSFIVYDEELVFDTAEVLYAEEGDVKKAIDYCLEVGLFNEKIYREFNVLTSSSIQKRYAKICKDAGRTITNIPFDFDLISFHPKKLELSGEETQLTEEETPPNSQESTQSKVKKRIVKNSRVEESKKEDSNASAATTNFSNSPSLPATDSDDKTNSVETDNSATDQAGGDILKLLMSNNGYLAHFAEFNSLSEANAKLVIQYFVKWCRGMDKQHKNLGDAKTHCSSWAGKNQAHFKAYIAKARKWNTGEGQLASSAGGNPSIVTKQVQAIKQVRENLASMYRAMKNGKFKSLELFWGVVEDANSNFQKMIVLVSALPGNLALKEQLEGDVNYFQAWLTPLRKDNKSYVMDNYQIQHTEQQYSREADADTEAKIKNLEQQYEVMKYQQYNAVQLPQAIEKLKADVEHLAELVLDSESKNRIKEVLSKLADVESSPIKYYKPGRNAQASQKEQEMKHRSVKARTGASSISDTFGKINLKPKIKNG